MAVRLDNQASDDDWADAATVPAYEQALSYIAWLEASKDRGDDAATLASRVQGFAMAMTPAFVRLVEARRPRALVVMAHFFGTPAGLSGFWWLGGGARSVARAQVGGIASILPESWVWHLNWPKDAVRLDSLVQDCGTVGRG